MSAVAGLWRLDGRPDAGEGCARMLAAQAIYGPHHSAQWCDGPVALGRRLTRLLPEDVNDRQPLVGGGGRHVVVADLRLDNREELAAALAIPGERARTLCDAAILLVALGRWGDACVEHLVGDYAFAQWDGAERRLLLARDPLGRRPLHYYRSPRLLAFASMPKGLHALADVPYAPDEEHVAEFLALLPQSGSHSFFREVERVEPGHVVTVTAERVVTRRFWEPKRTTLRLKSAADYADALRSHLDTAVRCRLRGASRAVGAHLSAGLDSPAVAATAARLLAPSGGRVVAFTSVPREGYDGFSSHQQIGDEGPLAAATAALYPNMEHVLVRTSGRSPLRDLDRDFILYDQPMLNICNGVWVHAINDEARARKLTVMLTGEMGNFGLSHSGSELLAELLRSGRWLQLWQEARALVAGKMRWRGVALQTLGPWIPAALWIWAQRRLRGVDRDIAHYSAIHPRRLAELDLVSRAKERGLDLTYRPWSDGFAARMWGLRRVDLGNYIKGVLGGWGVDLRDPTADVRLIEFCLSVPTDQFFRNGTNRALARRALADRLPREVVAEQRKGHQGVDWHEGLTAARDQVAAELDRLDACAPAARALDIARLRRLIAQWPTGGWHSDEITGRYRLALLRGLSSGHFLRRATGLNA
jgi:asparagine synthase (glutamine-hydrolysing)